MISETNITIIIAEIQITIQTVLGVIQQIIAQNMIIVWFRNILIVVIMSP